MENADAAAVCLDALDILSTAVSGDMAVFSDDRAALARARQLADTDSTEQACADDEAAACVVNGMYRRIIHKIWTGSVFGNLFVIVF